MKALCMLLLASGLWVIARAQAVEPRELLEVADFGVPVVSPSGGQVAFRIEQASAERNAYEVGWYVQGMDGVSPPRRIADGGVILRDSAGQPLPAVATWSLDGRWLYYRALLDGKLEVWRAAVDGSGAMPVTDDPADVHEFTLAENGETLVYAVGATREAVRKAEQGEYDHGIHVDSTVPVGQALFRSGYLDGRPTTQRYGKVWYDRVPLLADAPERWKEVNLRTLATRDLSAGEAAGRTKATNTQDPEAWIISRSPEDGRLATLMRVGERNGLRDKPGVRMSAKLPGSSHAVECDADACTSKAMTAVQWRPQREEVLFTVSAPEDGGAQSIYRWQVRTGRVLPVAQSTGLLNGGRDPASNCGVSVAALACVSAAADQPPRLERIDLDTGERHILFDPNARLGRVMAQSTTVKLLRWKGADGTEFTGQYYPAERRHGMMPPLFVNYYRCAGFVRGGLGDEWPFASLAAHGISAICINSPAFALDPVRRFDEGLMAVESIVKQLSSNGEIDCKKVGMGGLSFGSEVTVWVAMRSRLLAAASVSSVSVSPTYYLLGSLKGSAFSDGLRDSWGLGGPEETPGRWRMLSPAFNLEKISAPILFQVSEQEYLQAVDYMIPLIRKDRADLYVFPNEPHQKFQPAHKLAVYDRNVDWFRFWLQDFEDPTVAKLEQYAHWRSMREEVERMRASAPITCPADGS